MIITINELLDSGLPISEEIGDSKLLRAIKTAERFIVKPRLGDTLYNDITSNPSEYVTAIDGGPIEISTGNYVYLSGLKEALYELSFACLVRDNLTATIFGSIQKKDDYSDQADEERLNAIARYHTEIGLAYLKEITDYYNIDNSGLRLNNWYEELI